MKELNRQLKQLKRIDFSAGITSLWLVKRYLADRRAQYSILKVEIEKKLKKRLKQIVTDTIAESNTIDEYSFVTEDQDDRLLGLEVSDTDFESIRGEIDRGSEVPKAKRIEDLLGSWAYVIKLQVDSKVVYGFCKISTLWSTKKVMGVVNLVFENQVLIDLEDKQVFKIESKLDFLCFENILFILDKQQFESALNFRVGMEQKRDQVIQEFQNLKIFQDVSPIQKKVGNNLRFLRKISMVSKNGYYRNVDFMRRLKELNESEGCGLTIVNDQIIVTENDVELVLTLLNNDRLVSPINEEVFDVSVKKKV
jgi:hypothetical protein